MSDTAASSATKFFFELTPERILDSVEAWGVRCTGRILQLNSMENRVYEVEVEIPETEVKSPSDRFRVVKFYRPGRWSRAQIEEEHQFLFDLLKAELPVVAPLRDAREASLREVADLGIYCALFPKASGRMNDELTPTQLPRLGRLIARLHSVGAQRPIRDRLTLDARTYGRDSAAFLLGGNFIPEELRASYGQIVEGISSVAENLWSGAVLQRIHGDLHLGNLVWAGDDPRMVDFDDMVRGPPVQDLWMLVPGRGDEWRTRFELLLTGYEQMRAFDRSTLRFIEALRALRMIHYSAWIGRRIADPAFQRVFTDFGTMQYWKEQVADLNDQLALLHGASENLEY